MRTLFIIISLMFVFFGCSTATVYVPVSNVGMIEPIPQNGKHRVVAGETLYSIAWNYGLDYRFIAKRNHLKPPYHVKTGQIIYLNLTKVATPPPVFLPEKESYTVVTTWQWPVRGPILEGFSTLNKGINIGGKVGTAVVTAAPGKVVYSGNGLRSYGNLVIIKHNSTFFTAYAHNRLVFVKEGDWVQCGQKIAEMGNTGSRRVMLHFEIRKNGQPVNPLKYLTHRG